MYYFTWPSFSKHIPMPSLGNTGSLKFDTSWKLNSHKSFWKSLSVLMISRSYFLTSDCLIEFYFYKATGLLRVKYSAKWIHLLGKQKWIFFPQDVACENPSYMPLDPTCITVQWHQNRGRIQGNVKIIVNGAFAGCWEFIYLAAWLCGELWGGDLFS